VTAAIVNPAVAWFGGADAWAIDQAVVDLARSAGVENQPLDVWRASLDEEDDVSEAVSASRRRGRLLDEIEARLTTGTLFGGGTLVVVRQPGALARDRATRDRIAGLLGAVAPGNALAFADLAGADGKTSATSSAIRDAVAAAGGLVREYPALTRDRLEGWLATRAGQLGVTLGPGAARLLAERVGGLVREGDVDRRRQTTMANAELEKLALYRPGGAVSADDVAELVAEAIPGSAWAFLDAVGQRRGAEAAVLAERLLAGGTALPVLITQLHRRVRELIIVREYLDAGTRLTEVARAMRLQPFRAQKLAEQARTWTSDGLVAALRGLVDLDLRSKGITLDGSTAHMSEARDALGIQLWLAEHLASREEPTSAGSIRPRSSAAAGKGRRR
jgi:DNA polymerase III delta subunit